ncbi:SPFH domain-containing protein [Sphingomonas jatrophae]|uniref:Membrane protease subunit, stomatin/prohibitin family, contains C-terminal Zn-ribbon domain n=1 Tax=Sphingomonas jatrophae TaxID=1166337 RepID=A0A1I6K0B4_9SPHN|nr:SPFH domain-containing protein [Sphingomonas jatrophae]SFR84624.1 Membrane protease subunit, stomatin/prohibitin family, contains C-terminal Zn-ribbon domain [Sphingomonas jatrophae]
MGLGSFFRKQLIDVIEREDEPGVLAARYPAEDREIQNGAKLTVREAQAAAFFDEGQIADVFQPGLYTLDTSTLPLLTALSNWDKGFQSPFKSDVWFFSLREQVDRKWGTAQPITIRDKDFGPIRLRAHGRYSFAVSDVVLFWRTLVGNGERFTTEEVEPQLRAAIITAFATRLGQGDIAFLDMAQNQAALSETLREAVAPEFARFGLTLTGFLVESLSLPDEVQAHIDKAASIRALGNLDSYTKFQTAESIAAAAANPGGVAGVGASAAAGMAIGQAMAGGTSAASAPAEDPFALIDKLHRLLQAGAISQQEFDAKKAALLAKIG